MNYIYCFLLFLILNSFSLKADEHNVPFFINENFYNNEFRAWDLSQQTMDSMEVATVPSEHTHGLVMWMTGLELEHILKPQGEHSLVPVRVEILTVEGRKVKGYSVVPSR